MSQRLRKEFIKGIGLIFAAVVLYRTRSTWYRTLAVLGFASFIALILAPASAYLEKRGVKKGIAAFGSVAVLLFLMVVFLLVFVPYLLSHTMGLIRRMTPTVSFVLEHMDIWLSQWGMQSTSQMNLPQILSSALTPMTAGIAKGSIALISAIGHVVLSLVIAYYLLTVRYEAGCHILLIIPTRYRTAFISAFMGCRNAALSYLSGLFKTSAFVGLATFAGLLLLGVNDALILALFMGILEVLPFIGPVLGALPILLSVIPLGPLKVLLALLLVIFVQQIESGVIGPYFTASSTSIHPLAVIISVFIGGSLFGIIGVLLAVPMVVVVRSIIWSAHSASILFDS